MTEFSIYQINTDRDTANVCFIGMESLEKIKGTKDVNAAAYDRVYDGKMDCMNIFKKHTEKYTNKLPMTGKVKKGFRIYCTAIMGAALILGTSVTAFAAGDPITVINNLSTFIFGLIRAIGLILLGFGVVQVGLSLKSHDPSQRANGFLTLAGGVIITFAKEILDLIVG